MSSSNPGFGARIGLAFSAFFKLLFDGAFAAEYLKLGTESEPTPVPADRQTGESSVVKQTPTPVEVPTAQPDTGRQAMQLLGALQREGRFVDFLMEDLDQAQDADIGAAARVVHRGCSTVLKNYLTIEPIWPGEEGTQVSVDEGFNPQRIQLTGNISGAPPFSGCLQHRGWQATAVNLPSLATDNDPTILAPAEVEL